MPEIPVRVVGDLEPEWLKAIQRGIDDAEAAGWHLRTTIRFEGHPYIWRGEPRMASWTIDPEEESGDDQEGQQR